MRCRGLDMGVLVITLILSLVSPLFVYSQQTIQVVTKTIEKDLKCANSGSLTITGEKAEIEIHGWDKKTMHIKIQLISENKDRKIAEDELEYLRFGLNNDPSHIELSNSFIFPSRHITIHGNLKTHYEIWVPRRYIISIINKFGFINMYDLQTRTMIDAEYSNIAINKYIGYLSIKSSYSDLKANNINSDFECYADHADINLMTFGGNYHIEDKYGKIYIATKNVADFIKIIAARTPITIITNGMDQYNFDASTSFADIVLASRKYDLYNKRTMSSRTFRIKRGKIPEIYVSTTFENIDIK